MTKAEQIRAQANIEITNLHTAQEEGYITEYGRGALEALEGIVDFINILETKEAEEESSNSLIISQHGNPHIGDDLEEAATKYAQDKYLPVQTAQSFKAGAQWQKQQDQSTIELAEDHAYLAGQEKIIDKAIKWLEDNIDRYLYNTGGYEEYIPKCGGKMFEDFKKAMEE